MVNIETNNHKEETMIKTIEKTKAEDIDLDRLVRRFWCWIVGHQPGLNGQKYEDVKFHRIDGTTQIERRLVEREWCSRCRSEISVSFPNAKKVFRKMS